MNDVHTLDEAILDTELRHINFFNGRMLSAEDLTSEQDANRARALHLGMALGDGVACGLEVVPATGSDAAKGMVEITAGLAVNAAGQTLRLPRKETIALVALPDPSKVSECLFSDCSPSSASTTASAQGYYLLTLAPASKREGLASVSGLGGRLANCNSKYRADGVKFRFLRLQNLPAGASGNTARNEIAYACLGRPNPHDLLLAALHSNSITPYGLTTMLKSGELTEIDVPLAVVEWKSSGGLGFIDLWSVRRRICRPNLAGRWDYFLGDRRWVEGEATFLQFQEHIAALQAQAGGASSIAASAYFRYLPALGVLPTTGTGSANGFNPALFFGALASRDVGMLDADQFRVLLRESFRQEPIPLATVNKLQLYQVWENVRAVQAGAANQLVTVFASPKLPYSGVARFSYAKSSQSRFGEFVL